jgi:hypothetical protein
LNWITANKALSICEYLLRTDAHIIGEGTEDYGPYKFINPVPMLHQPGLVRAGMVLRLEQHFNDTRAGLTKTDTEFYHGGGFREEISALFSFAMGILTKSGGLLRQFKPHSDLLKRSILYDDRPNAIIGFGHHRGLILPRVIGTHYSQHHQNLPHQNQRHHNFQQPRPQYHPKPHAPEKSYHAPARYHD